MKNKKLIQELDKTTYDSAAKKASEMGMSSLSDKFKKHGEEHGLGKEKEIFTLIFKDRQGEHEYTYKVDDIKTEYDTHFRIVLTGSDNSDYEEQDQTTHRFEGFLSKSKYPTNPDTPGNVIKVWKSGEWRTLAKTRRDAKALLNILDINGVDTSGVDPRSLTYGYTNFDESIKRRKTLSEYKTNQYKNEKNMKKKIIKLNEKNLESLVKKVIREEKLQTLNEDRTDYEMSGARSRKDYVSNPRERDVSSMFGKYADDVPPVVIRYLRKNPDAILRRMAKLYPEIYMRHAPVQPDYRDYPQEDIEEGYGSYMKDDVSLKDVRRRVLKNKRQKRDINR